MADRKISVGRQLQKVKEGDFDYQELERVVEAQYLKNNREPGFKRKTSFSPSSIGYGPGTCPRRWYLAFTGAHHDDSSDALGVANMATGLAYHERIQQLFEDAGIMKEAERKLIVEHPPIMGFIDGIVEVDGIEAVVEFKTTRDESFIYRVNKNQPLAYHLYQILLYMYYTEIPQGLLWYSNKNDDTYLSIPIRMNDYTRGIIENAIEWMKEVRENWEQDVQEEIHDDRKKPIKVSYENIPVRPWGNRNKNCKQCPLFKVCWEEAPDGEKVIDPMEVVSL